MRKGKEFYDQRFERAIKLHREGKSIVEISDLLKISYSAVYHWVKGLRKLKKGNVERFIEYLKLHGPTPAPEIPFKKHNEIFLIAFKRGLPVKRDKINMRILKDYSTWYYLKGQEEILKKRKNELMKKFNRLRSKIINSRIIIDT